MTIRETCFFCGSVWGMCHCPEVPEDEGFEGGGDFIVRQPNLDESGRFFVDPVACYGAEFVEWRKQIAERVNKLWKLHCAFNGPKQPWTEKEKRYVQTVMPYMDPVEWLVASGAYVGRGATWVPRPKFPKFRFGFDSDEQPIFEGYDNGQTWNGWLRPLVTRETLEKVMAWFNDAHKLAPNDVREYKLEGDKLFERDPVDGNGAQWAMVEEGFEAETVDGKVKVWDIGLGLCWSTYEKKENA